MPTIVMNDKEISRFREIFKPFEKEPTNEYMAYFFKFKNASVSIYKSHKVVFQGSNLEMFSDYLKVTNKETIKPYDSFTTIGCDEVGTGDCFGPIVCAACIVKKEDVKILKEMGVNDSKKIDDTNIMIMGDYLIKNFSYKANVLLPSVYNRIVNNNNMNAIKAKCHNDNILTLTSNTKYDYVCLDQFCEPVNYFGYLDDSCFKNISFETKGESKSIAVAAASIIARYLFLTEWDKMEERVGFKIPKGAGKECDKLIEKLRIEGKEDLFPTISKMNFKNYTK